MAITMSNLATKNLLFRYLYPGAPSVSLDLAATSMSSRSCQLLQFLSSFRELSIALRFSCLACPTTIFLPIDSYRRRQTLLRKEIVNITKSERMCFVKFIKHYNLLYYVLPCFMQKCIERLGRPKIINN